MALDDTTKFEWDSSKRCYFLEIDRELYSVRCNGKIRYRPVASNDFKWMITDRNDCPFNGEPCSIRVEMIRGDEKKAKMIEGELEQYILKMEEE